MEGGSCSWAPCVCPAATTRCPSTSATSRPHTHDSTPTLSAVFSASYTAVPNILATPTRPRAPTPSPTSCSSRRPPRRCLCWRTAWQQLTSTGPRAAACWETTTHCRWGRGACVLVWVGWGGEQERVCMSCGDSGGGGWVDGWGSSCQSQLDQDPGPAYRARGSFERWTPLRRVRGVAGILHKCKHP